jgi:hypothetical protein
MGGRELKWSYEMLALEVPMNGGHVAIDAKCTALIWMYRTSRDLARDPTPP